MNGNLKRGGLNFLFPSRIFCVYSSPFDENADKDMEPELVMCLFPLSKFIGSLARMLSFEEAFIDGVLMKQWNKFAF